MAKHQRSTLLLLQEPKYVIPAIDWLQRDLRTEPLPLKVIMEVDALLSDRDTVQNIKRLFELCGPPNVTVTRLTFGCYSKDRPVSVSALVDILTAFPSGNAVHLLALSRLKFLGDLGPLVELFRSTSTTFSDRLQELDLHACKFPSAVVHEDIHRKNCQDFASALSDLPCLGRLFINIKNWGLEPAETANMLATISTSRSLTLLSAKGALTEDVTGFIAFCRTVKDSKRLEKIQLHDHLSQECIRAVADLVIRNNSVLKELIVNVEEGVPLDPLVVALAQSDTTKLERLEIKTEISGKLPLLVSWTSMNMLVDRLERTNCSLRNFKLNRKPVSDYIRSCVEGPQQQQAQQQQQQQIDKLGFYLKMNKEFPSREMLLKCESLTREDLVGLLPRHANTFRCSVAYCLLSANPSLWVSLVLLP